MVQSISIHNISVETDKCPQSLVKKNWDDSISSEYESWDDVIKQAALSGNADYLTYKCSTELYKGAVALLPDDQDEYDLLDVGSGLRCAFGCSIKDKKVNLVCCAPLADFYKKVLFAIISQLQLIF